LNMKTAQTSLFIKLTQRRLIMAGLVAATLTAAAVAVTNTSLAQEQLDQGQPQEQTGLTNIALTAIPPRLGEDNSILLDPGERQQVQVRVRNESNQPLNVVSRAADFTVAEDGFTPISVDEEVSNRWSLASWLTLVPQTQTLNRNETGAVNVLIEVPEDALPGGHYAMITHEPAVNGEETGEGELVSASAISQKVGTLLYVIVDGPINEEAFVRDFQFPKFTEFGPVPFSFIVENASDIHITPRTSIEIYNMFGRKVDTLEIEPRNVFPLMSRTFEDEWQQIWGTGLYTAKLTMSYGASGAVTMASTKFWLIPLKLLLAMLILILTAIASIVGVRRHYRQRQDQKQKKIQMLEQRLDELENGNNNLDKYED